jgi:uncharacterized protein YrrD
MKATQLRGMSVVSIAGAQTMGQVEDLVLNPDAQRVVAVRVKMAPAGVVKTVSSLDVRIGHDALTIQDARSVTEEELARVEGTVDLSSLLGTRVMSHGGNDLGSIEDVEIDTDLAITGYDLGKGILSDLFGVRKSLPAAKGMHYVNDVLMVPDERAAVPGPVKEVQSDVASGTPVTGSADLKPDGQESDDAKP